MKKYTLTLLLASSLVACGGSSSSSKPAETPPAVKGSFEFDTRTFDYVAIKTEGGWEQLTEKKVYSLKPMGNNLVELAWLCIEHDSSAKNNEFSHYIFDFSSVSENKNIALGFTCHSPLKTSTVNIKSGTANFQLTTARANDVRSSSSNNDFNDKTISFIVPSHRSNFDLLAIGEDQTSNKYYGHRKNDLILKDGENYSIDFHDATSAALTEFTPKKIQGFDYDLDYTTQSGINLSLPKLNDNWFILPETLKISGEEEGYIEYWSVEKNSQEVEYTLQSKQPGGLNRLTLDSAKFPNTLNSWSINKANLSIKAPAIPAMFSDYKFQSIGVEFYSKDSKVGYSFFHAGAKIANETINLKILDFSSLPNFKNLAPTLTVDNFHNASTFIAQYKDLKLINSNGIEGIRYSFEMPVK